MSINENGQGGRMMTVKNRANIGTADGKISRAGIKLNVHVEEKKRNEKRTA